MATLNAFVVLCLCTGAAVHCHAMCLLFTFLYAVSMHRDVGAVLYLSEHTCTKKQKYSQAAETINASFTPFVVTADGALGLEAKTFIRHLAENIAVIWHKSNCCWAVCVPECFLLSFVLRISAFTAAE